MTHRLACFVHDVTNGRHRRLAGIYSQPMAGCQSRRGLIAWANVKGGI